MHLQEKNICLYNGFLKLNEINPALINQESFDALLQNPDSYDEIVSSIIETYVSQAISLT